jgi:hypothetical protein
MYLNLITISNNYKRLLKLMDKRYDNSRKKGLPNFDDFENDPTLD